MKRTCLAYFNGHKKASATFARCCSQQLYYINKNNQQSFIQLFNRRRAGEIERNLIEDYKSHQMINVASIDDAYANFTADQKEVAMKYTRFTIRGKLSQTVPVLLHVELVKCCKLLLLHRNQAGVSKQNPYLFGIRGVLKGDHRFLRACELMRVFATSCGGTRKQNSYDALSPTRYSISRPYNNFISNISELYWLS